MKGAVELSKTLFPILFVTCILLLAVEAIWDGSVTPYFRVNYLIPATIIFGALALWLHRDRIAIQGETDKETLREAQRKKRFDERFQKVKRIPVLKWLVGQMYGVGWNYSILLFLVLLACFIIRYYYASISNLNLDEGNGLYDANLILQGKIPFKDYTTRAPGYLGTLTLFIKIFGYSMMTTRLLAIIADVVICLFIFKIGKELYNKNVGLVAALIYSLSPFFIYNDIIGYVQTVSLMWVPISVYFLVLAVKRNKLKYYFISGVSIGIAMLFYRGHFTYLILCPLALIYIHPWEVKKLFRNTATVLLGFCILVVPALAYFVLQTDVLWMWSQYAPPGFITTITHTVVASGEQTPYIQAKSRLFYTLFRTALYLFIPLFLFLSLLLKNLIGKRGKLFLVIAGLWAFALFLVVKGRYVEWYDFGQQPMPSGYPIVFFGLLGLLSLVSLLYLATPRFGIDTKSNHKFANIFLVLWLFSASIYFIISPVSSSIGAIPAAIMAAIAILVISQPHKGRIWNTLATTFLILLTLSAVFAWFAYTNTPNPDRAIKISVARNVGRYVNERTLPDDEILAISMFAVESNRRIILDISHPLAYIPSVDDPTAGYDPYDLTPTITEIINYLKQHEVKYIVAGPRIRGLFISDRHPDLRDYILENYTVEKSVDNVDIYGRMSN